ncbi:MAG: hypothetical protein MUF54_16935, partial [Polyangiaceae bacterium]|nr:hypothetical protein [Polyangiaceae bacterium]
TDASLSKKFEAQKRHLLDGITPSTGMGAVLNVALFLRRADELEKGQNRKATRKKDQEAMKLLAVRGITQQLRKHLAAQVKIATSAKPVEEIDEAALKGADESYVKALAALRTWYEEWSRIARVVVKRRDYLMLLGLAHRKSRSGAREEPQAPAEGP